MLCFRSRYVQFSSVVLDGIVFFPIGFVAYSSGGVEETTELLKHKFDLIQYTGGGPVAKMYVTFFILNRFPPRHFPVLCSFSDPQNHEGGSQLPDAVPVRAGREMPNGH
jgi:hypothetical protein